MNEMTIAEWKSGEWPLLAKEEVLEQIGPVVLTTHRVRLCELPIQMISIMLDEVTACGVSFHSKPLLLLFAVLIFVANIFVLGPIGIGPSIGSASPAIFLVTTIISVTLLIAYLMTRRGLLIIDAAQSSISVPISNTSSSKIVRFINALEAAKDARRHAVVNQ